MFCIIDTENNHTPIKSGFKTYSQANNWAKKNLPVGTVRMWGENPNRNKKFRYFIRRK